MLKNRISELEKQLSEKNAVIDFLTSQFITKPLNTSTNNISGNNNQQITNGNNKYNHHDTPVEKSINDKARKKVIIIDDSM